MALIALTGAQQALAQNSPGKWVLTPNSGAASGRAGTAPATVRTNVNIPNGSMLPGSYYLPTVFSQQYSSYIYPGGYPAYLNNGYVYANFGGGYQVVQQSCSTSYTQSYSQYANHTERTYEPHRRPVWYTDMGIPIPYPQGTRVTRESDYVSTSRYSNVTTTCYVRDASGRLVAYRY